MDAMLPESLRLDALLGLLIAFTALAGLIGGPMRAFLSFLSTLIAVVLTVVFAPQVTPIVSELFAGGIGRLIGAPILLFLALALILAIIVHVIGGRERPTLGGRFAGMVFGVLRGLVIALFLVLLMDRYLPRTAEPAWAAESALRPRLSALVRHIVTSLPAGAAASLDRLAPGAR